MADTADSPTVRKEGSAFVIQLPRRGKQRQEIPASVVENLVGALSSLALAVGEGVAVPKDDLSEPRVFEKQHQATNFGRKLKDELAKVNPDLKDMAMSTPSMAHDGDGKAVGPFALAFSKKEPAKGKRS